MIVIVATLKFYPTTTKINKKKGKTGLQKKNQSPSIYFSNIREIRTHFDIAELFFLGRSPDLLALSN